ncbi:type VI secretion system protein TssL, short form [Pantoea agglomerans]|uniref:Type VI secretion system protein TssL, short form n=1 Tax=Enterobacter agglomerans TaxID=549 RepID=A0ACC5RP20_ENTAG|nr:type VI secretion system protein TssL, short form [Pantoea agglomerans]MBK4726462.1 type VI secretion system protein TssL, short form [Pantoea agglomerans]
MNQKNECDIDALLQNSWLQVISLRHGPEFKDGEGRVLWQRCVAEVEKVQLAMKASGYSARSCEHVLYAQCALIDEVVKGRGVQDDACVQWYHMPLQGHFLGTVDAGDHLCNRMREVLHEPAPDAAVFICFQRVMMLGFLGGYGSLNDPERETLAQALNAQVPPLSGPQAQTALAKSPSRTGIGVWLSHWPLRIGCSVLLLTAVWWGLNQWLSSLVASLLPGVVQ